MAQEASHGYTLEQNYKDLSLFDSERGTKLEKIFRHVVELHPIINEVRVAYLDDELCDQGDYDGVPCVVFDEVGAYVAFSWKDWVLDSSPESVFTHRLQEVKQHLIHKGYEIDPAMMLNIYIAHELGHTVDFAKLQKVYCENAYDVFMATVESDLWHLLPLAIPPSVAKVYWENNTGGYRTYLLSVGYTEESFKDFIKENTKIYGTLPTEKSADDFALVTVSSLF